MNISFGDKVFVHGYEGEVIRVSGENVLIHFGGERFKWLNVKFLLMGIK